LYFLTGVSIVFLVFSINGNLEPFDTPKTS